MKYYIDTEFLEGTQNKKLLGITYGQTKPLVDLISIGIVGEDNREYYAISKEFNLKEAWNRFEIKKTSPAKKYIGIFEEKVYWIRENVLRLIYNELSSFHISDIPHTHFGGRAIDTRYLTFSYKSLKWLLDNYGKTNKQIAEEIKEFCDDNKTTRAFHLEQSLRSDSNKDFRKIEFYGYYADYDWVVFCWLFGNMIDLPDGFPMYCIDLKQELDRKIEFLQLFYHGGLISSKKDRLCTNKEKFERIKQSPDYPKQTNEHNALADAHWNKQLHEFINKL
jgi:hypothetical protein